MGSRVIMQGGKHTMRHAEAMDSSWGSGSVSIWEKVEQFSSQQCGVLVGQGQHCTDTGGVKCKVGLITRPYVSYLRGSLASCVLSTSGTLLCMYIHARSKIDGILQWLSGGVTLQQ